MTLDTGSPARRARRAVGTREAGAVLVGCVVVLSVLVAGVGGSLATATQQSSDTLVVDADGQQGSYTAIQPAVNDADPGDTVEVRGGTYNGDVTIDKSLTLRGAGAGQTTIVGDSSGKGAVAILSGASAPASVDDVTVTGFTIWQGSSHAAVAVETGGTDDAANANIHVVDNTLVAADDGFAFFGGQMRDSTIENNVITVASGAATELVYVGGARTYGQDRASTNVSIVDNTFNDSAQRSGSAAGAIEHEAADSEISGNDFTEFSSNSGVVVQTYGSGLTVENNQGVPVAVGSNRTQTIQAGIDIAAPGDTVEVGAGTYNGDVTIDKSLTLRGAGAGQTTIVGDGSGKGAVAILSGASAPESVDDVTVTGFTISQGSSHAAVAVETGGGDDAANANIYVVDNTLVAASRGFAFFGGHMRDSTIENNVITVASGSATELVYVGGARTYGQALASTNVSIVDNTFKGVARRVGSAGGAIEHEAADSEISGNDFTAFSSLSGVVVQTYGSGLTVENNQGVPVAVGSNRTRTIQAGVDIAAPGDTVEVAAGTYGESGIVLDEPLTIAGAGMDETVVDAENSSTSGIQHVFVIRSNGTTIRDLTMTDGHDALRISQGAHVEDFTLRNTKVNESNIGIYVAGNAVDSQNGEFDGVLFENTHWIDNRRKAIYVEKLSNATFDGLYIDGVTGPNYGFVNGIDINLKGGQYSNVTIRNSVVRNVAKGDPYGGTAAFSSAIAIKGRDDSSYSTNPGYLHGLTIDNVTVEDSFNGLRLGEPGKSISTPDGVTITDSTFRDNEGFHFQDVTATPLSAKSIYDSAGNQFDSAVFRSTGSTVWSTIQGAIDEAQDGDTVQVKAGTYSEQVSVNEGVTVAGAGEGQTTIVGPSDTTAALTVGAAGVTLEGFNVDAANNEFGIDANVSNVAVRDVTVTGPTADGSTNADAAGIVVQPDAGETISGVTFANVTVTDVTATGGSTSANGFLFDGDVGSGSGISDVAITGTTIEDVQGQWGVVGVQANTVANLTLESSEVLGVRSQDGDATQDNWAQGINVDNTGAVTVRTTSFTTSTDADGYPSEGIKVASNADLSMLTVHRNVFQQNGIGINVAASGTLDATTNSFCGNREFAVVAGSGATVDATDSYWGSNSGPTDGQTQGTVSVQPFRTSPISSDGCPGDGGTGDGGTGDGGTGDGGTGDGGTGDGGTGDGGTGDGDDGQQDDGQPDEGADGQDLSDALPDVPGTTITVPPTVLDALIFPNGTLADVDRNATIVVEPLASAPGDAPAPPGEPVKILAVDVPAPVEDDPATLRFRLDEGNLSAYDPANENLTVVHYDTASDEWEILETDVTRTQDGVKVTAETTDFSPFAVTAMDDRAATPTPTPTDAPDDGTATPTPDPDDSTPTPTDDGTSPTDGSGPGFGVVAAVVALLGAALLVARET